MIYTKMIKPLSVLLAAILFIQVFLEASSFSDAASPLLQQEDVGRNSAGFLTSHQSKINCDSECKRRCSKASRFKVCYRACSSCCADCGCVPPGTYGNKNVCPCYANQKTHGNKPKCP
ncbi:cypmaclein-like isoform X2 [Andrographis paniculata]|uniref:cypmaclein-like isoform X2 n=1 Tax=Andrographis paniculata TaxID=175694 RepID=UPI0021E8D87B|nr:cypmaclein-like isoform X2 [Andrographis paniculata]